MVQILAHENGEQALVDLLHSLYALTIHQLFWSLCSYGVAALARFAFGKAGHSDGSAMSTMRVEHDGPYQSLSHSPFGPSCLPCHFPCPERMQHMKTKHPKCF